MARSWRGPLMEARGRGVGTPGRIAAVDTPVAAEVDRAMGREALRSKRFTFALVVHAGGGEGRVRGIGADGHFHHVVLRRVGKTLAGMSGDPYCLPTESAFSLCLETPPRERSSRGPSRRVHEPPVIEQGTSRDVHVPWNEGAATRYARHALTETGKTGNRQPAAVTGTSASDHADAHPAGAGRRSDGRLHEADARQQVQVLEVQRRVRRRV
ncbi:hypothetical protein GCM10023335_20540 [Streptomyces siamensis]|uniref:Uncharacterized protein n=1 Tax=Streptomyces siamensis TaxID=1274986 RepID=A0ABP9INQ6_9ACTN